MTLTIYGITQSRARRNLWLAEELGIAYERRLVAQKDAPTSAELGRVNPFRHIPAIEDDGLALFESLAINLYLAKKHGGPLAPRDLKEDALMTAWALAANGEFEPAALEVLLHRLYLPAEQRDPAKVDAAFERLKRPLDALEAHLKAQGHLVGGRFTVADLNLVAVLGMLMPAVERLADWPATLAWIKAAQARPAFKKAQGL